MIIPNHQAVLSNGLFTLWFILTMLAFFFETDNWKEGMDRILK